MMHTNWHPAPDPLPGVALALVTGGAGFVGHSVVRSLVRRGVRVRVLDPAAPHPDWPPGVEHLQGDVRDRLSVERAARDVDLIMHVAGIWDGRPGGETRMRALNLGGTRTVLDLGRPTVFTSSSITCGFGDEQRPGTEDEPSEDPDHPIRGTPKVYRDTKLACEQLVTRAGGWIVNPDYVVGPGDVGGVVTRPLLQAARLPLPMAPRGGKCFVGIDDVGEGHVLAFLRGRPGRRYLLGAENRRYADVISVVARSLGRRLPVVRVPEATARLLWHVPRLRPIAGALDQMNLFRYRDAGRARDELGWRPQPVDHALMAMVSGSR